MSNPNTTSKDVYGTWVMISPAIIDVTGDILIDECLYRKIELSNRIIVDQDEEFERPTLIYLNDAHTIKIVAAPYWDAANGSTHIITVFKAAA